METNHDQLVAGDGGFLNGQVKKTKKAIDQSMVDLVMDGLKDGQPRKTLDIAKLSGFQTKQEVNPTLYYMQKQRLIEKVLDSPPTWRLNGADPVVQQFHSTANANAVHSPPRVVNDDNNNDNNNNDNDDEPPLATHVENLSLSIVHSSPTATPSSSTASLADQILDVIGKSDPEPAHSNVVAKAIGCRNKKEINPTLFDMQRKGLLQKIQDSPPLWILTNAGREIVEARPKRTEEFEGLVDDDVHQQLQGPIMSSPSLANAAKSDVEETRASTVASVEEKEVKMETQELAERLLFTLLQADNCTSTAVALAKALGFSSKRSINPCLFKLQSKGLTAKISDCPPVWSLTPTGVEQGRLVSVNPSFVHSGIVALKIASSSFSSSSPEGATPPNGTTPIMSRASFALGGQNQDSFVGGVNGGGKPLINAGGSSTSLLNLSLPITSPTTTSSTFSMVARQSPPVAVASSTSATSTSIGGDSFALLNKNPVSALTEFSQARRIQTRIEVLNQSGPPHDPRFTIAVFMGNRRFPSVVCKSKKEGKREAADAALRELIAEGEFIANAANAAIIASSSNGNNNNGKRSGNINNIIPGTFVMSWADEIAALAHKTFNSLALQITEFISGRKVLAAIIMKHQMPASSVDGEEVQQPRGEDWMREGVISLGTGNRCIVGTRMSLEGLTVNDCHAEVISRRGFLRYLYDKLLAHDPTDPESIFESAVGDEDEDDARDVAKSSGGANFGRRLRLKSGVSFHMYISTAPCGDGALFSPRDNEIYDADDATGAPKAHRPTFTSSVQGVLRTKMEGGEGTIPMDADTEPQTWDGIIRGERLRTMSCSDKIAKWNVTGVQGALLSQFLEPIYLSSVTLGYLFDDGHLSRALCCRLKGNGDRPLLNEAELPKGFKLNHPELGRVTVYDPPRETEKTKSISINWMAGDEKPEVCDGSQGLCVERYSEAMGSQTSQLCKKNLYRMFNEVCDKFGRDKYDNYLSAKKASTEFQSAKRLAEKAFVAGGYGHWLKKPVEEQMFE